MNYRATLVVQSVNKSPQLVWKYKKREVERVSLNGHHVVETKTDLWTLFSNIALSITFHYKVVF